MTVENREMLTDELTDELIDSLHMRLLGEPYYKNGLPVGKRFVTYVVGIAGEPITTGQVLEARMNKKTGSVTVHPVNPQSTNDGIGIAHITRPRDGSNPIG